MAGCTFPTPEQYQAVRVAAARGLARTHALIALAANTGLRAGTLAKLTWGHVCDGARIRTTLRIERRLLKGGRGAYCRSVTSQQVPINDDARGALQRYLTERLERGPEDLRAPLFASRKGGRAITTWQVNRIVQDVSFAAVPIQSRFFWA